MSAHAFATALPARLAWPHCDSSARHQLQDQGTAAATRGVCMRWYVLVAHGRSSWGHAESLHVIERRQRVLILLLLWGCHCLATQLGPAQTSGDTCSHNLQGGGVRERPGSSRTCRPVSAAAQRCSSLGSLEAPRSENGPFTELSTYDTNVLSRLIVFLCRRHFAAKPHSAGEHHHIVLFTVWAVAAGLGL